MPLDKSRRFYDNLIFVEIACRYDITRWRCFITPAGLFIVKSCKRGFCICRIQFRSPHRNKISKPPCASRNELRAIFAFTVFEDCISGVYPASLIGKFVGVGLKQHNMCIAFANGLYERGPPNSGMTVTTV